MREEHKDLVIGYSNRSTTRFAKLVQISREHLPRKMLRDKNSIFCLMDSAGLEDSRAEAELPNRVSFIEFVKDVDKLAIVIVINEKNWGTHGADIVKLAVNTSKMIRDMAETR